MSGVQERLVRGAEHSLLDYQGPVYHVERCLFPL